MFTLPRFSFYFGFKDSTGRHVSEMEFRIAGMKKSTHSETGQRSKDVFFSFLFFLDRELEKHSYILENYLKR